MSSRFSAVSSDAGTKLCRELDIKGGVQVVGIKADGILARARVKQGICDYPYQRSSGLFGCGHAAYGREGPPDRVFIPTTLRHTLVE